MIVLAIDPGDTVGVALYSNDEINGKTVKNYADINELITFFHPDTVVAENFFIRRGKPSNYHTAIKQIGVIEYICGEHSIPYELQSPMVLKTMMRHVPAGVKVSHIRSATAHLLYYLLKNGIVESGWKYGLKVGEL